MKARWILLAASTAIFAACGSETPVADTPQADESKSAPAGAADSDVVVLSDTAIARASLETVVVEKSDFAAAITVNGSVELDEDRTVRVAAFAPGIVRECCKSVGTFVRKGDVLAVLHSHQTHELLAQYRQAQAELAARNAELDYARQAHSRASRLHEIKAGPLAEVQRTEAALTRAERAVDSAKAQLAGAVAHFEYLGVEAPAESAGGAAPEHLEIVVRAPKSGTIIDRSVTLGGVVQEGDELYTVSDVSRVWVIAQVPEEQLSLVSSGMQVGVRVRAFPARQFAGRVVLVGAELDPETRLAAVRCSVPNPGGALKVGMYAEIVLSSNEPREVTSVPLTALQTIDGHTVVFGVEGGGRFRMRPVAVGEERAGRVEILSGVEEGDRVVAHGSFLLKAESMRAALAEE